MILFHDVLEILDLTDDDRGTVLLVVAADGRGMGLAPIDGALLGHAATADRLGEEAIGCPLVPLFDPSPAVEQGACRATTTTAAAPASAAGPVEAHSPGPASECLAKRCTGTQLVTPRPKAKSVLLASTLLEAARPAATAVTQPHPSPCPPRVRRTGLRRLL